MLQVILNELKNVEPCNTKLIRLHIAVQTNSLTIWSIHMVNVNRNL